MGNFAEDGICDNCGQTGFAEEPCVVCGGKLSKIDSDLSAFEEEGALKGDSIEPDYSLEEIADKEDEEEI